MNLELAQKLKDAGFPKLVDGGITPPTFFPTLEELIEACGDSFGSLEHFREKRFAGFDKEGAKWFAKKRCEVEKCDKCGHEQEKTSPIIVSGATAIETIVNLWLVLNKKL